MLSIHAVRKAVGLLDAPPLSGAEKCNPDIRILGPALAPPVNIPKTLNQEYIRQLSTQQLSAAEVGYLQTVMTSAPPLPSTTQKPQSASRCLTNNPAGIKKCVLPGRLKESNNLGFKPGRLLFGPSLLEPPKIQSKVTSKRESSMALSRPICTKKSVELSNSHQPGSHLGACTSRPENPAEQAKTPRIIMERGQSRSHPEDVTSYHGSMIHTQGSQVSTGVHNPHQIKPNSIAVNDSYTSVTINHDDYNSTSMNTFGQQFPYSAPPPNDSNDFRAGASSRGITLAPTPRSSCSMMHIQKLLNRSGSVLSTSSALHSERSPDSPHHPNATFSYESNSTGMEPYITSTNWQQHQHTHTHSSAHSRSDDPVVAPLNISRKSVSVQKKGHRENREDPAVQEPSVDRFGPSIKPIIQTNPVPNTSGSPMTDIVSNTKDITSRKTPGSFTSTTVVHTSTTAWNPSRQKRTSSAPLKTQMIGHFTLSPGGVVEFNGASEDIKLPLGEWNSMGRWVVRNNVQEEGTSSEEGDSDPFKLEKEVQALGFQNRTEKRVGRGKLKEVRFDI